MSAVKSCAKLNWEFVFPEDAEPDVRVRKSMREDCPKNVLYVNSDLSELINIREDETDGTVVVDGVAYQQLTPEIYVLLDRSVPKRSIIRPSLRYLKKWVLRYYALTECDLNKIKRQLRKRG